MATSITTLAVSISQRWWVTPYFWMLRFVGFFLIWVLDEEAISIWLDREVEFIVKHGLKFELREQD